MGSITPGFDYALLEHPIDFGLFSLSLFRHCSVGRLCNRLGAWL